MAGARRAIALASLLCAVICATTTAAAAAAAAGSEHPSASRGLLGLSDHKYQPQDDLKLYANKVGPFSNPR